MTSEVAVMNAAGVALAADSAVTADLGGRKVFRTASKLFMLSKYEPVGVMVFGSSDINGMPWETVIKAFRHELGDKKYPHLTDYARKFFSWLRDHETLFTREQQHETFSMILEAFLRDLRRAIDQYQELVRTEGGSEQELARAATASVEQALARVQEKDEIDGATPTWAAETAAHFTTRFRQRCEEILGTALNIDGDVERMLMQLPAALLTRCVPSPHRAGVVFAGFGNVEYLPGLSEWTVDLVIDGRLRGQLVRELQTSPELAASVVPFATTGMVDTFLHGVSPSIRVSLDEKLPRVFDDLEARCEQILGAPLVAEKRTGLATLQEDLKTAVLNGINKVFESQADSILRTVGVLPKGELAAMAEALVELTKFKQRISSDELATVDGEIDVAVISKGDGFVWIKRKQYFSHEHNPHWRANYYRSAVGSTTETRDDAARSID